MKIGLVGVSLFASTGYGTQTRGIAHTLTKAGHEIVSVGHESDVAVWGGRKSYRFSDGTTIETYIMPSPLPDYNKKYAVDVLSVYIDLLKLDLLIGHWDAFALEMLSDLNAPYLTYIPIESSMTQAWYNHIKNSFKIVCYSRYGYEEMLKFAPPPKVSFIPHGIDCEVFQPSGEPKAEHRKRVKSHIPMPEDCFLFTYVAANVGERKQIPLLLDTFETFAKKHDDAHLFLWTNPVVRKIGDGYQLLPRIAEPGLKGRVHVPFVNPVIVGESDESMAELYRASDCYISNSEGEGFGVPILEAMSCGIPSIGPRNSSHIELIEETGWLFENIPLEAHKTYPVYTPYFSYFPDPDQRSLLTKMEEAYQDLKDEETRKGISQRCRERALAYDWKLIGPKWVKLLKEVEDDLSLIARVRW